MSGDVDMRNMVEMLKKLGSLPEEAARIGAPLVEAEAKKMAAAGIDPTSGEAWPPLKEGKKRPLSHAADALRAKALGAIIQLSLAFPYFLHDYGKGHAPLRRILPRAVTGVFQAAVRKACEAAFKRLVKP